jgi:type I restriction enzyme S subunit
MRYSQFENYSQTKVDWLGDIPSHWEVVAIKRLVLGCVNGIWGSDPDGENDLAVIRVADFDRKELFVSTKKLTYRSITASEKENRQIKPGDLLIEKSGGGEKTLVGCVVVFDKEFDAVTSNFVARIRPKNGVNSTFLKYAFNHLYSGNVNYKSIKQTTGIQNIDSNAYLLSKIALPPYAEQKVIARKIDSESDLINQLIKEKQNFIKLLKEKRQALISHVVTKGLDPDVAMKDSGVEWIGQVPKHWSIGKLKYFLNAIGDVDHYMPESIDDGIPYVMTGDLTELVSDIHFEHCKKVSERDYLKLSKKIKTSKGDVIMARYATIGTLSYVDIDKNFLVSYSCVTINPNHAQLLGLYLFYYLKSHTFLHGIQNHINTNTQGNVGINDLRKVEICVPSLQEQERIINFLSEKTLSIDTIIKETERSINLLKEHRTALISAAVTGKIDLRDKEVA